MQLWFWTIPWKSLKALGMANRESTLVCSTFLLNLVNITLVLLINEAILMLDRWSISLRTDVSLDSNKHWVRKRCRWWDIFLFLRFSLFYASIVIFWNLNTGVTIRLFLHSTSFRSCKYGVINILTFLHSILVTSTSLGRELNRSFDHDFAKNIFKLSMFSLF